MMTRALTALSLCVAAGAFAAGGQRPEAGTIALINANVVSVRDGLVRSGATVVVRGARIESIGAGEAPRGARVIDAAGRYLVPGLIDSHAHITSLQALAVALDSGVTTARSAGVASYADVGMRELVRRGAVPGPEVLAAGYHVRPSLAEEAYLSSPSLARFMRPPGVVSEEAIREVVGENLARGVDWIKVLATERAGLPGTDPRRQVYSEAQLRAAVEAAAVRGVPVMAHAHGDEGARAAVLAGVRSIEHGTYLSDSTLELMKQRGTYLDPTFTTVVDLAEPGGDYDAPALRIRGRHMLPRLRDTIQRAHRIGVKIVAGSDTGYGPSSLTRVAYETASFVEMGMTPLGALQAATIVPAAMLRIESRTGALEPGLEADLLVVERNPLADPEAVQDVLLVMVDGQVTLDRLGRGKESESRQ